MSKSKGKADPCTPPYRIQKTAATKVISLYNLDIKILNEYIADGDCFYCCLLLFWIFPVLTSGQVIFQQKLL